MARSSEATVVEPRTRRGSAAGGAPRYLVVTRSSRPEALGAALPLADGAVIGRGSEAALQVEDHGVSRLHARVTRAATGEWIVTDLGSTNGSYVNGERIRATALHDGDVLQLGLVVSLRAAAAPGLDAPEERVRRACLAGGVGAWEWDAASGDITWLDGVDDVLPLARAVREFWRLLHPGDLPRVRAALADAARECGPCELECRLAVPELGERWLQLRGAAVRPSGGETRVAGTAADVTRLKHAEDAFRRQALLFESMEDAVLLVDLDGLVVDWNPAAERALGFAKGEVVGRPAAELLAGAGDDLRSAVSGGDASAVRRLEASVRTKEGTPRLFHVTAMPLRGDDGAPLARVAMLRDVTDQRRLEARAALAERLAALGALAAGVAHEINNPLAYVLGNLQYVLHHGAGASHDEAEARKAVAALRDACDGATRIRDIVRDLKSLASDAREEVAPTRVNESIQLALKMAEHAIRHRARLVCSLADVPPVLAAESRLNQVFLNLVMNAAEAIPDGRASENEIRVTSSLAPGGDAVAIEIADTGAGISQEHLARIFDPFFTSKGASGGTGLGLAICHSVIRSYSGDITVESTPGRGSTFRVTLPVARAAPVPQPAAAADAARAAAARPARVLVVDDEPAVGMLIARVLQRRGHAVTTLDRALDALARVEAGEAYDVVVCDLHMPDVTGMELHERLRAVAPAVAARMLFMTAGTFSEGARAFVDAIPQRILEKPIDFAKLERAIAAIVGT